jgi:hypothetical protein
MAMETATMGGPRIFLQMTVQLIQMELITTQIGTCIALLSSAMEWQPIDIMAPMETEAM